MAKKEEQRAGTAKIEAPKAAEQKPPEQQKPAEIKQEPAKAPAPKPEMSDEQREVAAIAKDMENCIFRLKFYPVAVNEESKEEAVAKLLDMYDKGNETVKQMLLYMIHEAISQVSDLRVVHTYEYFKMKNPAQDPAQLRMNVYRAMFNYNTSIEGIAEIIRLLGRFKGSDDAAKLLTYHFSHTCAYESEGNHMIRAVVIETLGKSESKYALNALLDYARYSDNERLFNRIVNALLEWKGKIEKLKVSAREKARLRERFEEVMTKEMSESHYR